MCYRFCRVPVKWEYALLYLDHIVIFSIKTDEYTKHACLVSRLPKNAGVSLEFQKCAFFINIIDYLDQIIRPVRLEVANHTAGAIRELGTPSADTETKSFQGLCNVFRWLSWISRESLQPFLDVLKNTGKGPRTSSERRAPGFTYLRKKFMSPLELSVPRQNRQYTLDIDAYDKSRMCDSGERERWESTPTDWVLVTSPHRAGMKPWFYTPRMTRSGLAFSLLRTYLEGASFTLRTDHHGPLWILNLLDTAGKLAHWKLWLRERDYETVHSGVKNHQAADTYSRLLTNGWDPPILAEVITARFVTRPNKHAFNSPSIDAAEGSKSKIVTNFGNSLPTLLKFVAPQQTDTYCSQVHQYTGLSNNAFPYRVNGIHVRQ